MSQKDDHKERAYELLRASLRVPFFFPDWQMDDRYLVMREKLRERKYTVKDTDTSYRLINHWEEKGLLPEGVNADNRQEGNGWRTFTIVEMAWLKVIAHLRDFGFPLEQIAHVKSQIIHWNKKFGYYPSFEYALAQALYSPKDTYLRVFANGTVELVETERIEMDKIISGSQDMLLISLRVILKELGLDFPELQNRLELSDEEFELFDVIRHGKHDEVRAKTKDGKIEEFEATTTSAEPLLSGEKELEKSEGYGRVTVQYEKGRKKSVQVVKRKRFDKK
jgi:DNA-binding transcriptional MerR regulator